MQTELKTICDSALDLAQQGLAWIASPANSERVGISRNSAEQQLRKSIIATRKTIIAIDRPMCVSVFGPSQAGKSYLVSVLARNGDAPLMAHFGDLGRDVDFIREINPGGDRESTGLVTRFSCRSEPSPSGFPVALRMLSEIDIAKILGNSFFFDGDPKKRPPLKPETVLGVLDKARQRAGASSKGMSEEDLWDLQEYFEKQFAGLAYTETLTAYWEEAAALAPRLSVNDRADLFAVLWGSIPRFTAVYKELVGALEGLGFAKDAYCAIDALIPRDKSIIDVATLQGLGLPDQDELDIRSMNGPVLRLPRPVITALAAELRITMTERPWSFFDHTDLLDFPGARSRPKVDLETYFNEKADALQGLFLRGKVAFLFDRYVAEQEISSMLLCIKPSNQEVIELPDMIDNWIQTSHGASPVDRLRTETALFLVLTMMDTHFTEKAGDEGQSLADRFHARMAASLTSYFGKAHKWPFEWTPKRPFTNTFWLRNPNFKAEFLIKYDGNREVAILDDKVDKIAALRAAYLAVDKVQRHFSDPARAFDEALKLNDGGVGYLAESLSKVCRAEIKLAQIRERIATILHEIRRIVAPYFVDSDIDKRLAERQEISSQILQSLTETWERNSFGNAMRLMQITQNGISEHLHIAYLNRLKHVAERSDGAKSEAALAAPLRPPLPGKAPVLPGAKKKPAAVAAAAPKISISQRVPSREAYLANSAMRHWSENLYALLRNDDALQTLGLDAELATELIAELISGALRNGVETRIAKDLADAAGAGVERPDVLLEKAGFFATSHINRFVNTLGFDQVAESKRPKAPDGTEDGTFTVFAKRAALQNCDNLPAERRDFRYLGLSEWMYSFDQLVTDNVMSGVGFTINVEQNDRLRAIIAMLDESLTSTGHQAAPSHG